MSRQGRTLTRPERQLSTGALGRGTLCPEMGRCKACSHPDRAAIDGNLVRRLSYRTVAGRYGLSVGTLHHHRAWHVLEPTLGDILEPDGFGESWHQWDGKRWLKISVPEREDLVEVSKGRPASMRYRKTTVPFRGSIGVIIRNVYRRRRTPKPLTAEAGPSRYQGRLLVTNRESFDWIVVKLLLNDQYVFNGQYPRRWFAGARLSLPTWEFVNDQGTRYDWTSTKPLKLRIVATFKSVSTGYSRRGSVTLHVPAGKPARGQSR